MSYELGRVNVGFYPFLFFSPFFFPCCGNVSCFSTRRRCSPSLAKKKKVYFSTLFLFCWTKSLESEGTTLVRFVETFFSRAKELFLDLLDFCGVGKGTRRVLYLDLCLALGDHCGWDAI